eukprot:TRINITY_DN8251_c0_g1_i1.p1 TRINITY_DN8251_c0_g1~~TRINITY_DN8251_c0_g1_i1.p1  ORF type:complete len:240 (-),score=15.66 TRINITY_DN8251_c0_g1_i1:9-728(-)
MAVSDGRDGRTWNIWLDLFEPVVNLSNGLQMYVFGPPIPKKQSGIQYWQHVSPGDVGRQTTPQTCDQRLLEDTFSGFLLGLAFGIPVPVTRSYLAARKTTKDWRGRFRWVYGQCQYRVFRMPWMFCSWAFVYDCIECVLGSMYSSDWTPVVSGGLAGFVLARTAPQKLFTLSRVYSAFMGALILGVIEVMGYYMELSERAMQQTARGHKDFPFPNTQPPSSATKDNYFEALNFIPSLDR